MRKPRRPLKAYGYVAMRRKIGLTREQIGAVQNALNGDFSDYVHELEKENTRLHKEADWLACELEKKEHGCRWCFERGKCTKKCGYEGPANWREAARETIEQQESKDG